ncbi:MAG: DUF4214 domain-containing protein [Clostridiales bacterium]|nr:DUF4214 domain-containing protein [Clostridiales bacterium]
MHRLVLKRLGTSLIALVMILAAILIPTKPASADETADAAAIIGEALSGGAHRCNVNAPRSGNVFLQLYGSFDATAKETILNQINSYRLEACRNGYPDPRNPSRRLTAADYVPIRWSRGLEEMAMLRASEATYTNHHLKITGEDCWNSSYDVASSAEILAWGSNIPGGLSMWYSERSSWTSGSRSVSQHYAQMINPSNIYCGVAGFNHTQACEFSSQPGLDESKIDVSQYGSQLVEIGAANVSGITVSSDSLICPIGSSHKLSAVCTISVLGYNTRYTYGGVKILPTTWWSGSPALITVDPVGNATGIASGMASVSCKVNGVAYTSTVRVSDTTPVRDFATRLYSVALNRAPDATGLDYWTNRLSNRSITGTQAAYGFFFSNEFINSNLSNEEYVTRLYRTFLGRDPESQGYAYWMNRLANGASRRDVFYGFSGSSEFAGICAYAGIDP